MIALAPHQTAFVALSPGEAATVDTGHGPHDLPAAACPWVGVVPHTTPGGPVYHRGENMRAAAQAATHWWLRKGLPSRDLWLAVRRELRAGRSVVVVFEDQPYYNKTRPVAVSWRPCPNPKEEDTTW